MINTYIWTYIHAYIQSTHRACVCKHTHMHKKTMYVGSGLDENFNIFTCIHTYMHAYVAYIHTEHA